MGIAFSADEVFEMAMDVEKNGEAYYRKAQALAKSAGVKAVFAESALPSKVAKTIANEAGVKVVDGEGALYGDGLGTAKSAGGTYLGMMRHNTTTIVDSLG